MNLKEKTAFVREPGFLGEKKRVLLSLYSTIVHRTAYCISLLYCRFYLVRMQREVYGLYLSIEAFSG